MKKIHPKILIDTNFLLIPAQFNVDIFSEFNKLLPKSELIIVDKTLQELKDMQKKVKGKHKLSTKLALSILKQFPIKVVKTAKHLNKDNSLHKIGLVDETILDFAIKNQCYVATQDHTLRKKLKENNINTIVLRQKKYLIIG